MTNAHSIDRAARLCARLLELARAGEAEEFARRLAIDAVLPRHRQSALNLAHYLGLRRQDVHQLQLELAAVGLSSLGRCEGHVHDTLRRLEAWLTGDRDTAIAAPSKEGLNANQAELILHQNTRDLFGPRPDNRHVYIMVTAPDASEVTPSWADALLEAGTDVLRINGAHESPGEWTKIAATFKARAAALGKPGRVIVDLPGPKLRADIRGTEAAVLHWPRAKDRCGRTISPTRVQLVEQHRSGSQLPVPAEWLKQLESADVIQLVDAGGRSRRLSVQTSKAGQVEATCDRSLYLTSGLPLAWRRGETLMGEGRVGPLPEQTKTLSLAVGDAFVIQGAAQSLDSNLPALTCPEAQLLEHVRVGERVVLDDGKLVAVAEEVGPGGVVCRVRQALKSPIRLKSGKGIAFPDSELALGQLSEQDEAALCFALAFADGVEVSFVSSASDVALVGERIRQAGKPGFGMILKLETRGATQNLPAILFEALKYHPVGLMIARGDLAVELSFERLAEIQEELLWFGEACHLPVVWATQVLDSVAHCGLPTRAEMTDAAMSMRAECVMLNKGPYIAEATRMLADIIHKMEAHQYKKRALYRKLSLAQRDV